MNSCSHEPIFIDTLLPVSPELRNGNKGSVHSLNGAVDLDKAAPKNRKSARQFRSRNSLGRGKTADAPPSANASCKP